MLYQIDTIDGATARVDVRPPTQTECMERTIAVSAGDGEDLARVLDVYRETLEWLVPMIRSVTVGERVIEDARAWLDQDVHLGTTIELANTIHASRMPTEDRAKKSAITAL